VKRNALVGVGFVVLMLFAYSIWLNSYKNKLFVEWSGLQKSVEKLDSMITTNSADFSDIKTSASSLKSMVETSKKKFKMISVPPGKGRINSCFIDYLEKTGEVLDSICSNCDVWSATEMTKLKQNSDEMGNSQTDFCATAFKQIANNKLFVGTASTLNKMHAARKKKVTTSTIPVSRSTVASSLPIFSVPVDQASNDYVYRVRSLLQQYKSLRGDLSKAHVSERTRYTGEISMIDQEILAIAKNNRLDILQRIENVPLPSGCESLHRLATDALRNGIDAIDALLSGDWDTFHRLSNNGKADRAYKAFGIGD